MRLFLSLFLIVCYCVVYSQTSLPANSVNRQVKISSTNNLKESWMICGEDSSQVLRMDSSLQIFNYSEILKTKATPPFTCLITLGKNKVLIGTKTNFAYLIERDSISKISFEAGLVDSCILGISYSLKTNRIYIESSANGFVSTDSTFRLFARFTKSLTSEIRHDKILKEYHSRNLLKYVFQPVRFIAGQIMPELIVKETHVFKERKISRKQRNEIEQLLEPGDILLKKDDDEWVNYVIPMFWTHTGIYIGNLRQINQYFKDLPLLNGMKPGKYLRKHYPEAYKKILKVRFPIIESITRTGVTISPLRNIATVDFFAAVRPILSKEDKFLSILKAIDYYKMPYDFTFDLADENALVCSGLVYKSYLRTPTKNGLNLEVQELLGSPIVYPGDIARKFDKELGTPKQELSFVVFFDSENSSKAVKSKLESFRKTWKR